MTPGSSRLTTRKELRALPHQLYLDKSQENHRSCEKIALAVVWRINCIEAKVEAHLTLLVSFLMKFSLPLCSMTQKHHGSLIVAKKSFRFISVVATGHLLGSSLTTNTGDNNPEYYSSDPDTGTQVENFHRLILGSLSTLKSKPYSFNLLLSWACCYYSAHKHP